MKKNVFVLALLLSVFFSSAQTAQKTGWQNLFNGKDFTG
ncbi:MAG: DUF1080 domain-containing protein, partial [Flavisolibacter sp.]|nr:DUF1080 domain-containing protein [Flavisolibacter sp.]